MQADAQSLSSKFAFQETQDGRSRYRERRKKHRDAESREREGAKDAIIPFARRAARRRRRPEPVSAAAAALLVSEIQSGIRLPFASPPSRFSRGAARTKLKMKTRARLELEVRRQGERRGRREGMSFFPDDASKKRGVVGVECQRKDELLLVPLVTALPLLPLLLLLLLLLLLQQQLPPRE
jgi:hypothetical protein